MNIPRSVSRPRPVPKSKPIKDPFRLAMLRRLDALAEAIDGHTRAIAQLARRIEEQNKP